GGMWHQLVWSQARASFLLPAGSRTAATVRIGALAASVAACLCLAGCASAPPPVDTTAPTVTAHTPADGDDNVSVHAPITVRFSEALAPESVTDSTVQLAGTGSIAIAKTLDLSNDGVLTVTPVASLTLPQDMVLSLTSGLHDPSGNALVPITYSWTLPNWLRLGDDPVMQYEADSQVYSPLLAVDGAGTLVVAGNQVAYPEARLRRWDGEAWQALPLPSDDGSTLMVHDIEFDDLGRLVMVWLHRTSATSDFYVSRLEGAAWTHLGDGLLVGSTMYPEAAAVAIGADGEPVVAWSEKVDPGNSQTDQYVKRWNGTSWVQLGSKLDVTDNNMVQVIGVALSLGGAPLVSWLETVTDVTRVRTFDATTSSWGSVGTSPFVDYQPQLLVPASGGLLAVGATTTGIRVYAFNGTNWVQRGAPALRQAGAVPRTPSVHLTAAETVVAAWSEYVSATSMAEVNVAELTDEGWVYLGAPIDIPVEFSITEPSLVLLGDDLPAIAVGTYEPFPGSFEFRNRTLFRQLNR
ncbi:MAG TPA: Ig-like domain-containing protein, partial [Trueperaceae bacterium]|nr:Ig-like domain-containing protein [Trueperaceae bacterium]